jgi:hypothetical protein
MSGHGRTRLSAQAHRRLSENFTPGRPESLQRCLFLAETRPVSCGIYLAGIICRVSCLVRDC